MPALKFAENYYSFRNNAAAFAITRQPTTEEQHAHQAALQAIEAKLSDAHTQFVARRYHTAIDAYNDASDMIHAQLVPNFPVGISRQRQAKALSAELFDSMLSTGLEWMNVLPVRQPEISGRPRIEPNSELLGDSARFGQLGVQSRQLVSPNATNALADWQLARGYAAQGNQPQAAVFDQSARRLAPDVVALLERDNPHGFEAGGISASGTVLPPALMAQQRVLGTMVRGDVTHFAWNAGDAPPLQDVKTRIYEGRVSLVALGDLFMPAIDPTGIALNLPHYYFYVIPLGLAECHHVIGDYAGRAILFSGRGLPVSEPCD